MQQFNNVLVFKNLGMLQFFIRKFIVLYEKMVVNLHSASPTQPAPFETPRAGTQQGY